MYAFSWLLQLLTKEMETYDEDFDQSCDSLQADTLMYDFQHAYKQSSSLLCSKDCNCSLSSDLITTYKLDSYKKYTNVATGARNVQKCPTYDTVFSDDVQDTYAAFFKHIEEENSCAGVCNKTKIFQFSNLNDGVP